MQDRNQKIKACWYCSYDTRRDDKMNIEKTALEHGKEVYVCQCCQGLRQALQNELTEEQQDLLDL